MGIYINVSYSKDINYFVKMALVEDNNNIVSAHIEVEKPDLNDEQPKDKPVVKSKPKWGNMNAAAVAGLEKYQKRWKKMSTKEKNKIKEKRQMKRKEMKAGLVFNHTRILRLLKSTNKNVKITRQA